MKKADCIIRNANWGMHLRRLLSEKGFTASSFDGKSVSEDTVRRYLRLGPGDGLHTGTLKHLEKEMHLPENSLVSFACAEARDDTTMIGLLGLSVYYDTIGDSTARNRIILRSLLPREREVYKRELFLALLYSLIAASPQDESAEMAARFVSSFCEKLEAVIQARLSILCIPITMHGVLGFSAVEEMMKLRENAHLLDNPPGFGFTLAFCRVMGMAERWEDCLRSCDDQILRTPFQLYPLERMRLLALAVYCGGRCGFNDKLFAFEQELQVILGMNIRRDNCFL